MAVAKAFKQSGYEERAHAARNLTYDLEALANEIADDRIETSVGIVIVARAMMAYNEAQAELSGDDNGFAAAMLGDVLAEGVLRMASSANLPV